jgi:hypothetical protein
VCILVFVSISGCTATLPGATVNKTLGSYPDPQTGIVKWVNEMNNRDLYGLYQLAPGEVRQQISYEQFEQANQNNELFTPGWAFTNVTILNETINQSVVTIKAQLLLNVPGSNSTQSQTIPIYDTYTLTYEDNEWKVWDM